MYGLDQWPNSTRDSHLNAFDSAAQLQLLEQTSQSSPTHCFIDNDEVDVFADAGLDYEELEFMDPAERRKVLLAAGLEPGEFDF